MGKDERNQLSTSMNKLSRVTETVMSEAILSHQCPVTIPQRQPARQL